jgi:sec-independent protein translocase protein TatA
VRLATHFIIAYLYILKFIAMNTVFAFFGGLGGWEILLIMLVILIFFGAKRIPELARGLGKGIREFKDATTEIKDNIEEGGSSKESTDKK